MNIIIRYNKEYDRYDICFGDLKSDITIHLEINELLELEEKINEVME